MMFKSFSQFVPSSVCLKCDGCCRFKEADSRWRPHMTAEEQQHAASPHPVKKIFASHVIDLQSRIKTVSCQDGHMCYFLNPKDNTCGIYHSRPFECQLYPFLLGLHDGQPVIYVHLNCPFIQDHGHEASYEHYVLYLKDFLGKAEVLAFLQGHPALFADYSSYQDELKMCFKLPFTF